MIFEPAKIAHRKSAFLQAANEEARHWYDDAGQWIAPSYRAETRERFWLCFALYANGSHQLADAIIYAGQTAQTPQTFSIFDPNIACALLVKHRDKMAEHVRRKLEELVIDAFGFKPGNRQPDFQFHGYNDNMPAKATLGLVLGGELFGHDEAVQHGLWNLRQLRAMLVRRGTISEFNSPTYAPLTLHAIAEVAEHAKNEEARELARGIESRLWLDLAARFHPETGVLAGPYSRAYTVDSIAHLSNVSALLWFHIGDGARPSPMDLFAPPPDLVLHHKGDVPYNIAQICWLAAAEYHVPGAAWKLLEKKTYPFQAIATSETGDNGPDFPARAARLETWQQPDYSVGTSSSTYGGGQQSTPYFATYRRGTTEDSFRDVGTVFSKFVINDELPGDRERRSPSANIHDSFSGEVDLLTSHSNTITLQEQEAVLILTHPHLDLGGAADEPVSSPLSQPRLLSGLSELVIFPSHQGGADELMVGSEVRNSWDGEARHGEWIVCRRGRLLIGIRLLAYGCDLERVPITLEKIDNYEVIRSNFYTGAERAFSRQELRHVFGGFVAEHASTDEYASLSEFAAMLAQTKFTDYFWTTRRVRYRRPKSTQRALVDMEVSWSSGAHEPRYATINGRTVNAPSLQIDGLRDEDIPFLHEQFQPVSAFFPWQNFEVAWEENFPYAIGDRES